MIDMLVKKITRHYKKVANSEAKLESIRETSTTKLHLGCGLKYKDGFTNVDAFSEVADVKEDICYLDSFQSNSIDLIETHHVLEHLSFSDAISALGVWSDKLKKGGFLIISVPDIDKCFHLWRESSYEYKWNDVIKMIYGSQEHEGMFHKCAFNPRRLTEALSENNLSTLFVINDYPQRPTPSFLVLAQK